jgi:hypothetical protein
VRRHAVLLLPEGVGQHVQLASTNKCLAESNKSRVGAKATKYRPLWGKVIKSAGIKAE